MFYPELLRVFNGYEFIDDTLIDEIDTWLGLLTDNQKDKITVSRFSNRFGIDYNLSRSILKKMCSYNILKELYAIKCPECNHILKITDRYNLYEAMQEVNFCYSCNNDVIISDEDIQIRYKLVLKPNKSDKMKRFIEQISDEKETFNELDTIKEMLKKESSNEFYYCPSSQEYEELKVMFEEAKNVKVVDSKGNRCTGKKGEKLEIFVEKLMNLIKPISATRKAKTSTNQLDTFCKNHSIQIKNNLGNIKIENNTLRKMGASFICECKNEDKPPKNDYFGKLSNILTMERGHIVSGKVPEHKFGIIFSRMQAPSTYLNMSKKLYISNNITIINFCFNELNEIVYKKKNILDYIDYKIDLIHKDLKEGEELKGVYKLLDALN
ncbi:hypothetical protein K144316041_09490 [Clostridium tetani]|uniref:hypothetical protein n=1 Tax=Clostridium tetani TaxID=1513 RepID=UPI0029541D37|nr:hypothetical protein [Clostridium tetani]BDR72241.1 hypothetical protein K144316041_09490 [Clostridium tetani]